MKLLHLVPAYFPEGAGGIQNYVRRLVQEQRARGHEVAVLTGQPDGRPQVELERDEFEGVPVWRLYRNDPFLEHFSRGVHPVARERILELVEREGFERLHLHSWIRLSGDLVARAAERGVPSLVTLHDYLVSCPRCYRSHADGRACARTFALENCLTCAPRFGHESDALVKTGIELFAKALLGELDSASAVLMSTAGMAERLRAWTAWDGARTEVLGLPEEVDLPRAPDVPDGPPWKLITWGRHSWHKGTGLLLDALRALGDGVADFRLEIWGPLAPDDFAADLATRAEGLPVTFRGEFDGSQLAAAQAHLALFTTACLETHGLVLDEARALGWPALVPNLGALADRLDRPESTYVHDDPQDLARALDRWRRDADWRAGLIAATASKGATSNWREHVERLDQLLREARVPRTPMRAGEQTEERWRELRRGLGEAPPF